MPILRHLLLIFLVTSVSFFNVYAQNSFLRGKVVDSQKQGLAFVSLKCNESQVSTKTDSSGRFILALKPNVLNKVEISLTGFTEKELFINLNEGDTKYVEIILSEKEIVISEVKVVSKSENYEASTLKIDPRTVKFVPSPFNDFNKVLTTLPGVSSNSELSSTYSVRGGNYDENLVYVNGMEVYRPFLIRSGQQEGLSFVNQDLVSDIEFSSGGWKAKYGDKLSSVLSIKYKEPKKFEGSFSGGLLGGTAHLGGTIAHKRITYIIGARNKSSQYLLNSLPVQGQYLPKYYDIQSFVNIDLTKRSSGKIKNTTLGLLMSYARNRYNVIPSYQQTSFGTSQQIMSLNVAFDGQESLEYDTYQGSLKLSHIFNDNLKSDFIVSLVDSREREYSNLESGYRLSDGLEATDDQNIGVISATNPGLGTQFNYARNRLHVSVFSLETKNIYTINEKQSIEFGFKFNKEQIQDIMNEYSFSDSADYVTLGPRIKQNNTLESNRLAGFIQHNYSISEQTTFTSGLRTGYWSLNNETIFSPRFQLTHKSVDNPDIIYKFSAGVYNQPPFYREMRDFNGKINRNLKSQKSLHFIAGRETSFKYLNRKFKFSSELYYKYLYDVVPYDVDNVRLRYYAANNAVAYATGADFRISGEFIKGEESWFSLGILRTQENVDNDDKGYIRRPTDQLVTFGVFFQDHLPSYPTIKMYLNGVYGSGLPFGVPDNANYRQSLDMPSYKRVDIGLFKFVIFDEKSVFSKYFESIWLGIEILNVIGANNTISYLWIKDVSGNKYAVPNTLSQRFFNARLIVKF